MTTNPRSAAVLLLVCGGLALAQEPGPRQPPKSGDGVPDLRELVSARQSEMQAVVRRYEADRGSLSRTYSVPASPTRHARMKRFHAEWLDALEKLDGDSLSREARADHAKLRDTVRRELRELDQQAAARAEIAPLVPFAPTVVGLEEARRRMEKIDSARAAGLLNDLKKQIGQARKAVETSETPAGKGVLGRAASAVVGLRGTLKNWFNFYNGYDPVFTWWAAEPYKEADQALEAYAAFLREKEGEAKPGDENSAAPEAPKPGAADGAVAPGGKGPDVPDLRALLAEPRSEMREVIQKFQADRGGQGRLAAAGVRGGPRSPERLARAKKSQTDWLAALDKLDFDALGHDGQIDYLLLKNHVRHELRKLDLQERVQAQAARLTPFEAAVLELDKARRDKEKAGPERAARALNEIKKQLELARWAVEEGLKAGDRGGIPPGAAAGAAEAIGRLRDTLKEWFDHYGGADPQFADRAGEPYKEVDQALQSYAALLRDKVAAGPRDQSGINGRPIGREALLVELAGEMIPYTPDELVGIAEAEFAWCEREMRKASRDLGFGDDWRKALEKVKTLHPEPGKQPEQIRELAVEAIDYLRRHNPVTVPPLAAETWRMEMMSPQRQLVNPFFTGGETISVSFPTNTMAHEAKLQSMRGNNVHFARATVHHELIPGHHLQGFMTARYRPHRGMFSTSFWGEGWALYWEMVLYDMGFARTPEDRVGFLFWRSHRCARILFSLNYHLGKWAPQECIDFLVDRVGHERDNATAEVRRSFATSYGPLYQAAYMLGGLQFRALRKELVDSGKMAERDFHDAILKENRIPVAMVRASLSGQKLTRDHVADWRFYGPVHGPR